MMMSKISVVSGLTGQDRLLRKSACLGLFEFDQERSL